MSTRTMTASRLNYVVAVYLIVIGLVGLLNQLA
jgi:hypothetical protein